jgi:diguanylate cyclase (GGDEF)-like protein
MEEAVRYRDGDAAGDGLGEPETAGLALSRTEAVGRAMSVGAEVVAEADRQGTEFPSSLLGLRALADRVAGRCGQRVEAYDDDRQPLEGPIYLAPSDSDAIRLITSYDGGRWLVCELDRNGRVRADGDSADPAVGSAPAAAPRDPFQEQAARAADQDTRELAAARLHWRIAAILFFGGGFGAIPSDALHSPHQPATIYLLPLLAIVSGLVCWGLSTRLSARWLHLVAVAATLEIALTVGLADRVFAIYYTFVAIYAAYVFRSRAAIALHVGFASLAVLAPVAYDPETARQTLVAAFALIPTLILAGGTVTLLREQLEKSEERFRRLAERDPLTGVGNYRMLTDRLPRELARHRRFKRSLALIVIDLDDFKRVNDRFGHQHGDRILCEVGRVLNETVRGHDVVARQGGDEFSVVAPETDRAQAIDLAARLRCAFAQITVAGRPLGASTGLAVFPDDAETIEQLLARADSRLREVKARKPCRSRSSGATSAAAPAAL